MQAQRKWLLGAVMILGVCPLLSAANITYTVSGTLGPILSGSDPLGANGESGVLTAKVSNTLVPTSKTQTSATYTLPVGAITVVIGGTTYATSGTSTLKYTYPATGPDTLVFTANISVSGLKGTVVGTASLAHGSVPKTVAKHPVKFTPSPQTMTAAKKAGGPGSQVKYTAAPFGSTVLGIAGTVSN